MLIGMGTHLIITLGQVRKCIGAIGIYKRLQNFPVCSIQQLELHVPHQRLARGDVVKVVYCPNGGRTGGGRGGAEAEGKIYAVAGILFIAEADAAQVGGQGQISRWIKTEVDGGVTARGDRGQGGGAI